MNKLNMPERIIECVRNENNNPEFIDLITTRLSNVLEYANIPLRYIIDSIDINNSSSKLSTQLDRFLNIIDCNESCLVVTNSFAYSGYIAAYIFEQYVYSKLITDEHIKSILYIDTNLLVEDYKKLITKSQNNSLNPRLHYDVDLLYNKMMDADFIFWDKFNYITTDYSFTKLYEVLSSRFQNCLGNCFFASGPSMGKVLEGIDIEFLNTMNCNDNVFDFQRENYNLRK